MYQPTYQRPVYQLHIIRCGTVIICARWKVKQRMSLRRANEYWDSAGQDDDDWHQGCACGWTTSACSWRLYHVTQSRSAYISCAVTVRTEFSQWLHAARQQTERCRIQFSCWSLSSAGSQQRLLPQLHRVNFDFRISSVRYAETFLTVLRQGTFYF